MGCRRENRGYGVCDVWGVGQGMQSVGCGVWDTGCGVQDAGCGIWGVGCEVRGMGRGGGARRAGCGLRVRAVVWGLRCRAPCGCRDAPAYNSHQPSRPEVGASSSSPQAPPPPRTTPPAIPRTGSGRPRGGGASAAGREEERAELRWRRRRCWSSSARSPCCPPTARRPSASCTPSVSPGAPRDPSGASRPIPAPSVPRRGRLLTHGAARPAGLGAAGPEWRGLGGGRVGVWGLRLPVGLGCDVWGSGCGAVRAV